MTDNFIQQFDEKMKQLDDLRSRVDSTIVMNKNFTQNLKERLNKINNSITTLYGLIGDLIKNKNNFENDLNANKTNIQKNTDEITIYKQTINNLRVEKQQMEQRLTEQEQTIREKINEKQNIVAENEAKLRDLKQANERQQTELSALREQITNQGTQKDKEHTEALKLLNEQNEKQLAEQEAQLLTRISELENQITALNQQLSSNNEQLTNSQQSLQQQINEKQQQIEQLTNENQTLQGVNQDLHQRIQLATQAIQTAVEDLTKLMNEVSNATTQKDIDIILNSITQQIEESINMINNNIKGQPLNGQDGVANDTQQSNNTFSKLSDDQVTKNNIDIVFENLKSYKSKLNKDSVEENRVTKSINDINSQYSNGKLTEQKLKQFYNNAFQKGGKRTRKMRKNKMRKTKKQKKNKKHQKGGFLYNTNTKRKKLNSSKSVTRSKSSNRTRTYSSKTSSPRTKSTKTTF